MWPAQVFYIDHVTPQVCYIDHITWKGLLFGEYRTGGAFDPPMQAKYYIDK